MENINSHPWSTEEALFYLYLTTIPMTRASEILTIRANQPRQEMAEFAENMAKAIPNEFFSSTLAVPNVPRFVIRNGEFQPQYTQNLDGTQPPTSDIRPEETRYLVEQRSVRVPARPPGRIRSLNSFMVFRAFISPVLGGVSQMAKSRTISMVWADDPFQPVWAVLAATYTTLRDHFYMPNSSLKRYLEVVCCFVGLPTPSEYLKIRGWRVSRGPVPGKYSITRCAFDSCGSLPFVPVSVYDIVYYCRFNLKNYAIKRPDSKWPFMLVGESTMAVPNRTVNSTVVAQPNFDPLYWVGNENDRRSFTWDQIYGRDDESVPTDQFIFVPPSDEQRMEVNIQSNEALFSSLWAVEAQPASFAH